MAGLYHLHHGPPLHPALVEAKVWHEKDRVHRHVGDGGKGDEKRSQSAGTLQAHGPRS